MKLGLALFPLALFMSGNEAIAQTNVAVSIPELRLLNLYVPQRAQFRSLVRKYYADLYPTCGNRMAIEKEITKRNMGLNFNRILPVTHYNPLRADFNIAVADAEHMYVMRHATIRCKVNGGPLTAGDLERIDQLEKSLLDTEKQIRAAADTILGKP